MNSIDYTKVSDNQLVIKLIKEREKIDKQIEELDSMALYNYAFEALVSDLN